MNNRLRMLDHDVVGHGVFEQRFVTHVLAEAAGFDAAVRGFTGDRQVIVHPGHAGLDLLADAQGASYVVGPHAASEAVAGIVGEFEGVLFVVEGNDG